MECYASMASRHKTDVENAVVRLQELVGQDSTLREKERVCTMLAIGTGLTLLRQTAKAKNQLRAIDRMPYKWDDGDDFERAWLMLASIHMQVHIQFCVSGYTLNFLGICPSSYAMIHAVTLNVYFVAVILTDGLQLLRITSLSLVIVLEQGEFYLGKYVTENHLLNFLVVTTVRQDQSISNKTFTQTRIKQNFQAGKQEAAEELCKKCLKYNKECSKAWELLGLIMEKNHSYPEAISFYENVWKCLKEASPAVGYRLAYTYLKDKRHIEAITVCQKVLAISPNYPKIKKDILDKARVCVRA